uniref:G-patch domain-containing protein n=1 Tax=Varanus komodoensis TaxID=61221 RepID=A0A8D2LZH0_VARKO
SSPFLPLLLLFLTLLFLPLQRRLGAERPVRVLPRQDEGPAPQGAGEEEQRPLALPQPLQEPGTLLLPLQLALLQVLGVLLPLLLALPVQVLLQVPLQKPQLLSLLPEPLPLPLPLQVLLAGEAPPLALPQPDAAVSAGGGGGGGCRGAWARGARRGAWARPTARPLLGSSAAGLGSSSGPPPPDSRLGEENRGHQMLVKMGWSGSGGLGAKEQGIQDPIKGGDIRDKWDQYKGVGVALDDPYENYRRNKSYSFIARMKARDESECAPNFWGAPPSAGDPRTPG